MLAIKLGGDILNIAQHLSWRDFEMFASEILLNSGFLTLNNVRFTKPRAEIDIVATKSHLGLSIDCKHWSNNGRSALVEHIRRQHQRTKRLLGSDIKFKKVVPLLLTIYPNFQPYNPNLVTVVDINNFTTFVNEIESHIDQVLCLSRD